MKVTVEEEKKVNEKKKRKKITIRKEKTNTRSVN